MNLLEFLKNNIKDVSDQKINETIPKLFLKMNDEQITTVSFAFWLVYMTETDLNNILNESWTTTMSALSPKVIKKVKEILKEEIKGKKEIDINNLEYFSDKIKIYEAMFGETERTELLWKLNDIRNDLSHNRINDLKYDGQLISLRKTKEKILIDYFETTLQTDFSKSEFLSSLTENEKKI